LCASKEDAVVGVPLGAAAGPGVFRLLPHMATKQPDSTPLRPRQRETGQGAHLEMTARGVICSVGAPGPRNTMGGMVGINARDKVGT
jgi:hypothetical protein